MWFRGGVRTTAVRRSRYRGQAKTGLAHVLSAAAINLHRIDAHDTGHPMEPVPLEKSSLQFTPRIGTR